MYRVTPEMAATLCQAQDGAPKLTPGRSEDMSEPLTAIGLEESAAKIQGRSGFAAAMRCMERAALGEITLAQAYLLSHAHFADECGMSPEKFTAAWRERLAERGRETVLDALLTSDAVAASWPWRQGTGSDGPSADHS